MLFSRRKRWGERFLRWHLPWVACHIIGWHEVMKQDLNGDYVCTRCGWPRWCQHPHVEILTECVSIGNDHGIKVVGTRCTTCGIINDFREPHR